METVSLTERNIDKVAEMFPNVVTEVKDADGTVRRAIDFDALKAELSADAVEGRECYEFTWAGKTDAKIEASKTIRKTLRPCKEESKNWDATQNLYIEGDNLDVLKLLQESYLGKVKMIYIDPPYNTGNDFVYADDFRMKQDEYEERLDLTDDDGNRMIRNPETLGRFHSNWCSMIYSRLKLARNLLTDDGVIFISIDDNEQANLKKICDEIFGAENFVANLPRITKKSGKEHSDTFAQNHDYILVYSKNVFFSSFLGEDADASNFSFSDEYVNERGMYKLNQTLDYDSLWYNPAMDFPLNIEGEVFYPGGAEIQHRERHNGNHNPKDWVWRWSQAKFDFGYKNGFIVIKNGRDRKRIYTKTYLNASIEKNQMERIMSYIKKGKTK